MNPEFNNPNPKEMTSIYDRMETLAASLPTLRGRPGTQPRVPEQLDTWAVGLAPGHGPFCAARFVLAVWNSTDEWKCGPFKLMEALACWDREHHAAFLEWAREPWWP